ncbi:unnamed protein product [Anisakis simplex]|uniref:Clathrin assembly protein n=1 Tax=Anisakis simplex TaxID=6269 RepID=A0A0M3K1A4_ANISI|nr:unnamed protein product [Anisakis simplex]
MAVFGDEQRMMMYGNNMISSGAAGAAFRNAYGMNEWNGWNQNMPMNQNNALYDFQQQNNMQMQYPNQYPNVNPWANQQLQQQQCQQQQNLWYNNYQNPTAQWGSALNSNAAWNTNQQSQWMAPAQSYATNLADPNAFNRVIPSAVSSTATAIPTSSRSNLVLGNGTSGNLWEHAHWPSSTYILDAPHYAGIGR